MAEKRKAATKKYFTNTKILNMLKLLDRFRYFTLSNLNFYTFVSFIICSILNPGAV